jgi:hypothetical protein
MNAFSDIGTNIPNTALAAALMMSFATNCILPTPSTKDDAEIHFTQEAISSVSTARPTTKLHIVRLFTPETQAPQLREEPLLQDRFLANAESRQFINSAIENLQTEEALELFEVQVSEFIDKHAMAGIRSLQRTLLETNNPINEALARRFLRSLGVERTPQIDAVAKDILLTQLYSVSAGRRSAAASSLGAFPSYSILMALEGRLAIEENKVVRATLEAHIRVFKANGIPFTKAA